MYLVEALNRVRERLEANGARPETIKLVGMIGSQPGADRAQVRSLTELVRRLMRTPVANQNFQVYDDLSLLEEQLERASAEVAAERAAEESRPLPKSKKYYKTLKEKEERKRA